jgi:hypothetical protein
VFVCYRSAGLYHFVKDTTRGWEGQLHRIDRVLGYAPIPASGGIEMIPGGEKVPVWYNSDGFRTPPGDKDQGYGKKPLMLFLGCSFTFGSGCRAENTFPFLIGEKMGGSVINAGVNSYGFSNMVLRARELVPKYKPDIVFFQVSPWLFDRAVAIYRPTPYWTLPMPYYAVVKGKNEIQPPPFMTGIFDVPIAHFRKTPRGQADFFEFAVKVAAPLYLRDDWGRCWTGFRMATGFLPRPNTSKNGLIRDVILEMNAICKENGAKLAIIFLGDREISKKINISAETGDVIMIDAEKPLWDALAVKSMSDYSMAYQHVAGDPPHVVDMHPNDKAHAVIADAVYRALHEYMVKIKAKKQN